MSDNPNSLQNWFIGVGVVVALIVGWLAMGQPGKSLQDGDYGCSSASASIIGGGPGATVENGEVVDVWSFDMNTGTKTSLRWSDPNRKGPKEFSVTSEVPTSSGSTDVYICTY